MNTNPTTDERRRLGGTALVIAPLVVLAAAALHPREVTDAARQLDIVASGLNRWYVAHLLYIVGFALFVPAVLAMGRRLRVSAPRLELWGTSLTVVGLVASAGLVAAEGFGAWQLAQAPDRASATATFDHLVHSAGVFVPLGVVGLAVPAGLLVLAIGLGRTASVAAWAAWALGAGAVLLAVGLASAILPVLVVGVAALAVAMGSVGLDDLGSQGRLPVMSSRMPAPSGAVR